MEDLRCPACESGIFGLEIDTDTDKKYWQCEGCLRYISDEETLDRLETAYEENDYVDL